MRLRAIKNKPTMVSEPMDQLTEVNRLKGIIRQLRDEAFANAYEGNLDLWETEQEAAARDERNRRKRVAWDQITEQMIAKG